MNEVEMERLVTRLTFDSQQYQQGMRQVQQQTHQVAQVIKKESDDLMLFGQRLDQFGMGVAGVAGGFAAFAAVRSPMATFKESINIAAEAEMMQSNFETMLGSADAATKMVGDLVTFAAKTPLEMRGLQSASKLLMQFGTEADDVIPTLRMLGDVALGDQQKLMQLSLAFGQASSTGRLMGQDLLQMVSAGFNPLMEISRTTGRSVTELRADMEKGKISVDMLKGAFKSATSEGGRFAGGMEKASKTLTGLLSTMEDDLNAAKRAIGEQLIIMLHLKQVVAETSIQIQAFTSWFKQLSPEIQTAIFAASGLVAVLGVLALTWRIGAMAIGIVATSIVNFIQTLKWGTAGVWTHIKAVIFLNATNRAAQVAQFQANAALGQSIVLNEAAAAATKKAATATMILRGGLIAVAAVLAYAIWRNFSGIQDLEAAAEEGDKLTQKSIEGMRKRASEAVGTLKDLKGEARAAAAQPMIKQAENELAGYDRRIAKLQQAIEAEKEWGEWAGKNIGDVVELEKALQAVRDRRAISEGVIADLNKDAREQVDALSSSIKKLSDKLNEELLTSGMSADEKAIWRLKTDGATEAALANVRGMAAMKEEHEKSKKAIEENRKAIDDLVKGLKEEIEVMGMNDAQKAQHTLEIRKATQAEKDEVAALMKQKEDKQKLIDLDKERVEAIKKFRTPQEEFNDEVKRLQDLLTGHPEFQETFNRGIADATKKLNEASGGARGLNSELTKLDLVMAGSAEARSRIATFAEVFRGRGAGMPNVAGAGAVGRPSSFTQGPQAIQVQPVANRGVADPSNDKIVKLLERIAGGIDNLGDNMLDIGLANFQE